jgi:lipoprotein-releasing system ATP-binding protein
MEQVLRTHKITKYFYDPQKFQVLKEIDLVVNKGEFLSLVGKSGCGKSTLMYVLSTMDTDYEGELEISGQRLTGLSLNELAKFRNEHIGFVFQFHYLLPEFTALQNVMIPALKLGRYNHSEVEERAYEKLKMLGMQDHALKRSNKLSGGQPEWQSGHFVHGDHGADAPRRFRWGWKSKSRRERSLGPPDPSQRRSELERFRQPLPLHSK